MDTHSRYASLGFDSTKIGFGRRCGIVVVDFQRSLTDPSFPMGGGARIDAAVEATARLLAPARAAGLPVASCVTGYSSARDALRWKIADVENWILGTPGCDLDPRIHDPAYDTLVIKRAPSIFFQTGVSSFFTQEGVDTVIVTGCATSGCIRASVIDAFSHGFRVILPEECSGDHDAQTHAANLCDMGRRYADVMPLAEVLAHLESLPQAKTEAPVLP
ncbi:hydrolase [Salipiger sp. CCB-MM3]|uniref:isochorismatase family protein n=1 Tax=Salipiger sp. CCB-MM3 TaxID=1792508 RepID=UPI00080AB011|nr:isochorismatase family protein [Salipiger sp. CCB-MM3]ANT59774.1 hydrolase [Salipiger sp. CCB-MM3]